MRYNEHIYIILLFSTYLSLGGGQLPITSKPKAQGYEGHHGMPWASSPPQNRRIKPADQTAKVQLSTENHRKSVMNPIGPI